MPEFCIHNLHLKVTTKFPKLSIREEWKTDCLFVCACDLELRRWLELGTQIGWFGFLIEKGRAECSIILDFRYYLWNFFSTLLQHLEQNHSILNPLVFVLFYFTLCYLWGYYSHPDQWLYYQRGFSAFLQYHLSDLSHCSYLFYFIWFKFRI